MTNKTNINKLFEHMNKNSETSKSGEVLIYSLPVFSVLYIFYFTYRYAIGTQHSWRYDKPDPENPESEKAIKTIARREAIRGQFASIASALLLNVIGAIMIKSKVPENLVVLNYGFILGPVIGYMFDMWFGKEIGLQLTAEGDTKNLMKYVFGSIASPQFFRYIITVILDLFISDPLMTVIKKTTLGIRKSLSLKSDFYSKFLSDNFASMLQSIVGVVTFNAYTNQTRFNWAYPDKNSTEHISKDLILMITALASIVYLTYFVYNIKSDNQTTRLMYVLFGFLMLLVGESFGLMNSKDDETSTPEFLKDSGNAAIIGGIIFILLVCYGIIYPFYVGLSK